MIEDLKLYSRKEAAKMLGLSEKVFDRITRKGGIRRIVLETGGVRYTRQAIEEWQLNRVEQ